MRRPALESEPVEVRPSEIDAAGVFALRDYRAGERIRAMSLVREVTATAPLRPGEDAEHCMYADGRVFLVGEPDRYLNHCCEPNAYKRFEIEGVVVVAMRDIAAGEEITLDYMINTHGGSSWACGCGAPTCRGTMVASFFDLPMAVQRKYRTYLADWFVEAHRGRVGTLEASDG